MQVYYKQKDPPRSRVILAKMFKTKFRIRTQTSSYTYVYNTLAMGNDAHSRRTHKKAQICVLVVYTARRQA